MKGAITSILKARNRHLSVARTYGDVESATHLVVAIKDPFISASSYDPLLTEMRARASEKTSAILLHPPGGDKRHAKFEVEAFVRALDVYVRFKLPARARHVTLVGTSFAATCLIVYATHSISDDGRIRARGLSEADDRRLSGGIVAINPIFGNSRVATLVHHALDRFKSEAKERFSALAKIPIPTKLLYVGRKKPEDRPETMSVLSTASLSEWIAKLTSESRAKSRSRAPLTIVATTHRLHPFAMCDDVRKKIVGARFVPCPIVRGHAIAKSVADVRIVLDEIARNASAKTQ